MACPRRLPPLLAVVFLSGCADGCRGEDLAIDCDNQATKFFDTVEKDEKELVVPVPAKAPYPVAFQLTEEGVNRLLQSKVNDSELPFTGDLDLGAARFEFVPDGAPTLELAELPGCSNCLVISLAFEVLVYSSNMLDPLNTGFGSVKLAVPLELDADETSGTTELYADYSHLKISEWDATIYGISSEENPYYSAAIQHLLQEHLQESYGQVELMSIGSWDLGDDIKLLARELIVYPEHDKMVLGMQTNLALPDTAGLFLEQPLPEGVPMAVTFDSRLFLAMSQRMLTIGNIKRRYNEDGNPRPDGIYGVTLDTMRGSESGASQLDSEFQIWRIANGYCGNVRASMSLALKINDNRKGFSVAAGAATLLSGEGSGLAALEEQNLVDDNQKLLDNFRGELADSVGSTINYDAFNVEGSRIVIEVVDLTVSDLEVDSLLDFQVYKLPED